MYRELHGNLSLWSVIPNESSVAARQAKSGTMNEEANVNFCNVFMKFYKFCVTVTIMITGIAITLSIFALFLALVIVAVDSSEKNRHRFH